MTITLNRALGGRYIVCSLWVSLSTFKVEPFATFPGIRPSLRKIALKLNLRKVIEQNGDWWTIKTCSTFQNYTISFRVGQEFEEFTEGLDNRHVKVNRVLRVITKKSDSILLCVVIYTLLYGVCAVTGDMAGE